MKYVKNPTRIIEAIVKPAENCFGYFTQEKLIKLKEKLAVLFCFVLFALCAANNLCKGGSFKGREKSTKLNKE